MRNREARLSSSGGPDARSEAGCAMRSALRFCLGVPARRGTILGPSPEGLAMRLREATPEDAEAIVAVPVAAWRAAYVGIVPEPALAAMSVGEKTERRRHSLMLSAGDATSAFEGESYAISLLRRAQRVGLGRRLMTAMSTCLGELGFTTAILWAARDNSPARLFTEFVAGLSPQEARGDRTIRRPKSPTPGTCPSQGHERLTRLGGLTVIDPVFLRSLA